MQGDAPLLTVAQISATLAGFTSVLITLRGSSQQAWSSPDRFGLVNVLAASSGTLFGSLLPFPLAYLGWSEEMVWGVTDAAVGALILGAIAFLIHGVIRALVAPRAPRVFWSFVGSGFLVAAMLLLSAFDLLFPRGPALLLTALIWALLAAFAQLATFVLVTASAEP